MTYHIKGWTKFQHYQSGKRNPDWIKLYRGLLDDIDWHLLDPKCAKALVMLWLLASESSGALPPIQKIAFRLRLSESETKSILSKLSHWVEQDDSDVLAECYQSDSLEENKKENKKERENGASAPPKRSSQIPQGWTPSLETLDLLKTKKGFPPAIINSELEKFRDFHQAKGSVFKDFEAAFRTWMAKAREFATSKNGKGAMSPVVSGPWKPFDRDAEPVKISNEEWKRTRNG